MGTQIELRPVTEADFDQLIDWVDSPAFLLQWAGPDFSYPLDESQLREHLEGTSGHQPARRAYTAIDAGREMVGYLELTDIDRENESATVSRVIVSPDERGQGYGTAMVERLLAIGFREVGLHRIALVVFDFNEAAIACYETAGFTREGVLRDARKHGDEYWTLVQMSVLESEWRTSG